ncbi:MAG: glycosyltransferase family 2 protein [Candidatus Bathyarchaeia archaeon]|jgi:glycosyltransferase involved in cell wall biosynthesis
MVEIEAIETNAFTEAKPFIVVGIPAFNEERNIARIILDAQKFADEVIVCDDGSSDHTSKVAERSGADVIKHSSNLGYGAALQSLFKNARSLNADVFITIDADGQHDPQEIPLLINPIVNGDCDVVVGSRFIDKNGTVEMPIYRQIGVKVITKLVNGSAKNGVSDAQSGFRAYNSRALECLTLSEMGMGASIELLMELKKFGLTFCEVPISCKYKDSAGKKTSSEHPLTHGIGLLKSIIRLVVEDRPLLAVGVPGIIFLALGTLFGAWMLQLYADEHRIVTNIALASMSFIFMAFFMLSTAITLYAISRIKKNEK